MTVYISASSLRRLSNNTSYRRSSTARDMYWAVGKKECMDSPKQGCWPISYLRQDYHHIANNNIKQQ
jgi:hypothetical protein